MRVFVRVKRIRHGTVEEGEKRRKGGKEIETKREQENQLASTVPSRMQYRVG